jgi:hypothetical protein
MQIWDDDAFEQGQEFTREIYVDILGSEHGLEAYAFDESDEYTIAAHFLQQPHVLQVRSFRNDGTRKSYINPLYGGRAVAPNVPHPESE